MTPVEIKRFKNVIVAASAKDYADIVRKSGFHERQGMRIIPIAAENEITECIQEKNVLLVIDKQFPLRETQERLMHQALAFGAEWCPLLIFQGFLNGHAHIRSLHDVLEWIHWREKSVVSAIVFPLICLMQRSIALALAVVLAPVFIAVSLAIKKTSPGPVFYQQTRVGHRGKHFKLIKFRTMRVSAEQDGPRWCAGNNDSRIYPLGRLLRASHIDEFPQLWNVIKGDLCFVGPRPERPEFHDLLENEVPHFRVRARVRPGITGWAQLRAGYAASVEESKLKVAHDLYFIRAANPILILKIIFDTGFKCIRELKNALLRKIFARNERSNLPSGENT